MTTTSHIPSIALLTKNYELTGIMTLTVIGDFDEENINGGLQESL
jgi:hypothetical protein